MDVDIIRPARLPTGHGKCLLYALPAAGVITSGWAVLPGFQGCALVSTGAAVASHYIRVGD